MGKSHKTVFNNFSTPRMCVPVPITRAMRQVENGGRSAGLGALRSVLWSALTLLAVLVLSACTGSESATRVATPAQAVEEEITDLAVDVSDASATQVQTLITDRNVPAANANRNIVIENEHTHEDGTTHQHSYIVSPNLHTHEDGVITYRYNDSAFTEDDLHVIGDGSEIGKWWCDENTCQEWGNPTPISDAHSVSTHKGGKVYDCLKEEWEPIPLSQLTYEELSERFGNPEKYGCTLREGDYYIDPHFAEQEELRKELQAGPNPWHVHEDRDESIHDRDDIDLHAHFGINIRWYEHTLKSDTHWHYDGAKKQHTHEYIVCPGSHRHDNGSITYIMSWGPYYHESEFWQEEREGSVSCYDGNSVGRSGIPGETYVEKKYDYDGWDSLRVDGRYDGLTYDCNSLAGYYNHSGNEALSVSENPLEYGCVLDDYDGMPWWDNPDNGRHPDVYAIPGEVNIDS